ncbi:MAG: dihydrofolate reductase family protein [Pirellulales bacterium]
MRRICYSVAMSLDGYIAGPNGEFDWILMDPEIDFGAMMSRFDTLLMGRGTFAASQTMGPGGMPGMKTVVVSTTLRPEDHAKVTLIGKDVEQAVKRLKAEPGKDIWLFGGGKLFRSLLDARLVDAVEVAIIPVVIGGGLPMLPPGGQRATLKLVNSKVYQQTGTVLLEYAVDT